MSVYVSGKYAYAAGKDYKGIAIVDISDPTTPVLTGSLTDAINMEGAHSVYVSGKYAYVASYASDSLAIIDIHGTELTSLEVGNLKTGSLDAGNIQAEDIALRGGANIGGSANVSGDFAVGEAFSNKSIKSGATQPAGVAVGEFWKTASHATLPDNVVLIGV